MWKYGVYSGVTAVADSNIHRLYCTATVDIDCCDEA